ncbi:hypothetical protein Tco_0765191 [Tanacetum coccineum]
MLLLVDMPMLRHLLLRQPHAMLWASLKKKMEPYNNARRASSRKSRLGCGTLRFKGNDVVAYIDAISTTSLMCARRFPEESEQIERYYRWRARYDNCVGKVSYSKTSARGLLSPIVKKKDGSFPGVYPTKRIEQIEREANVVADALCQKERELRVRGTCNAMALDLPKQIS